MNPVSLRDRYRGSFLGLAAGDALGMSVEFKPPGSFEPLTDMVGGGAFDLRHRRMDGRHLDGTVSGGEPDRVRKFDAGDQMACFVRWYREGYLSSTSECFDIGNTTAEALQRFEQTGAPFAGSTDPDSAGNGSIMRLPRYPCSSRVCRQRPSIGPGIARAPCMVLPSPWMPVGTWQD